VNRIPVTEVKVCPVCKLEAVPCEHIVAAIEQGAREIAQLKARIAELEALLSAATRFVFGGPHSWAVANYMRHFNRWAVNRDGATRYPQYATRDEAVAAVKMLSKLEKPTK
jgi:hypothetical protein